MLWSFAFAQPLLDLVGDAPEFFVARENTRADILVLAFGLVLLPPLALLAIEWAVALASPRWWRRVHLLFIAVLAAAFALQLINDVEAAPAVLIAVAVALGVLVAAAYRRTTAMPLALTVLSPAPVLFLALFLIVSPVSKLVLPGSEPQASSVAIPGGPPIVVLVFDEFSGYALMNRDNGINADRYPGFERLARGSTWYRNATTVADFTERAVPALVTGDRPERERSRSPRTIRRASSRCSAASTRST